MAKDCVKTGRVVRLEMMRKIWKTWLDLKIGTIGKNRLD